MASVHTAFADLAPYEALGKKIQKTYFCSAEVDDAQLPPAIFAMTRNPDRQRFLSLLAVISFTLDKADVAPTVYQILSTEVGRPLPLEDVQALVNQLHDEFYPSGDKESRENQYRSTIGPPELLLQNGIEKVMDQLLSRLGCPTLYLQRDGITKLIDTYRLLAEPKTSLEFILTDHRKILVGFELVLRNRVRLSGEDLGDFTVKVTGLWRRIWVRHLVLMVLGIVVAYKFLK